MFILNLPGAACGDTCPRSLTSAPGTAGSEPPTARLYEDRARRLAWPRAPDFQSPRDTRGRARAGGRLARTPSYPLSGFEPRSGNTSEMTYTSQTAIAGASRRAFSVALARSATAV